MKGKNEKDVSAENAESNVQDKKTKQKGREEGKTCSKCRWYDKSTERDFHRKVGPHNGKGERSEIVEVRAVCRNPKAKAFNRLVHATLLKRECPHWEKGVYKAPEKPEKKKTSDSQGSENTEKNTKNSVTLTNKLNGETKTFEKKGRKLVVKEGSE